MEHNQPEQIKSIEIGIYDMMGRLIRNFNPTVVEGSYAIAETSWDFTNNNGSKVAEGIYIARIIITTANDEQYSAHTKIVYNK